MIVPFACVLWSPMLYHGLYDACLMIQVCIWILSLLLTLQCDATFSLHCQYHCDWLPGQTYLWNNVLCQVGREATPKWPSLLSPLVDNLLAVMIGDEERIILCWLSQCFLVFGSVACLERLVFKMTCCVSDRTFTNYLSLILSCSFVVAWCGKSHLDSMMKSRDILMV